MRTLSAITLSVAVTVGTLVGVATPANAHPNREDCYATNENAPDGGFNCQLGPYQSVNEALAVGRGYEASGHINSFWTKVPLPGMVFLIISVKPH
jgi:hypothetical protein